MAQKKSEVQDKEAQKEDVEALSAKDQEVLAELPKEAAELAAPAAKSPLNLQSPEERVMTGAQSEEQAKEQEKLLKDLPEDYTGEVNELGEPLEKVAKSDVKQEDVIDFRPPPAEADAAQKEAHNARAAKFRGANAEEVKELYGEEGPHVGARRDFNQRSQLWTDGLSGPADHALEKAYRVPDVVSSKSKEEEAE